MKKKIITLTLVTLLSLMQAMPVVASETVIEDESTYSTELEWTKPSTWEVVIPELTTTYLNSGPVATGNVSVTADLLGCYALKVTTNPVVTMTQAGKADVLADVTMSKEIWTYDEAAETPVPSTVTMTARDKISSGEYKGTLTYTVKLINDPVYMVSNAKYYLATDSNYTDDRATYPFSILKTKYPNSTTDKFKPSVLATIWTATGHNSGNSSYYKYLDTKLAAIDTNYSAKDVVIIAPGVEFDYLYNHPAQYPWWDTTGVYTEIGGVNSSLQTDVTATVNLVLDKQNAVGIDAPVIFIQKWIVYGTQDHKDRIRNAFESPNVQAALTQDNVIYLKERDILVNSDYYTYSNDLNNSGNLKMANAIEAALIEYYSR